MQRHRVDIDGLRTLAIIPVVLFHMGFGFVPAGFLGVDVFFVISGYLITGILVNELELSGRINLIKFYERRIRRILPGFLVVLIFTFVAGWYFLLPNEFNALKQSTRFSLMSLSNVYFLGATNYFSPDTSTLPLIHTWSLSVEEQFYVIFPVFLLVTFKFVPRRAISYVLAGIFLASLLWAQLNLASQPSETFYLIQFRAWELLAGAIATIQLRKLHVNTAISNLLSSVGLVAVLGSYVFLAGDIQHPGFATLTPIIGTVLVLVFSNPQTLAYKLLSLKPMVFVGLLSYSLYLWHQSVFALARSAFGPNLTPVEMLPWLAVAAGLAYLSWRFIENVFRNREKMSAASTLKFVGLIGSAVFLASFVVQVPVASYAQYSVGTNTVTVAQLEARLSPNYGVNKVCTSFLKHQSTCTSGNVPGGPTVALWGDSFSMHIVQALQQSPTKAKFISQSLITCNPIFGIAPKNSANGMKGAENCNSTNTTFMNYLLSAKAKATIRTVILASHWENIILDGKTTLNSSGVLSKDPTKPRRALQSTIDRLKAAGYRVVVVSSPAYVAANTGACLKNSVIRRTNIANCNFPMSASGSNASNALLQELVSRADKFINLTSLMCPKSVCRASVGNYLIYRDKYHISREGSAYLGRTYDLMGLALR